MALLVIQLHFCLFVFPLFLKNKSSVCVYKQQHETNQNKQKKKKSDLMSMMRIMNGHFFSLEAMNLGC